MYFGGSSCCQGNFSTPYCGGWGYGYGYNNNNSSYAIILVLFILLVIVIGCRVTR